MPSDYDCATDVRQAAIEGSRHQLEQLTSLAPPQLDQHAIRDHCAGP